MEVLLRCIADCWRDNGAPELAKVVLEVGCEVNQLSGSLPPHLSADFSKTLAAMNDFLPLQEQLRRIGSRLHWSEGDWNKPTELRGRFAAVELAGPTGMVLSAKASFGLVLQTPAMAYPSHYHEAVEHFLVLSGTADWQKDDGKFVPRPPGSLIVHASNQPHATTSRNEPMLAMWMWQGNLSTDTYTFSR